MTDDEETCIAWFREYHAALVGEIEELFVAADSSPPTAAVLLAGFPRSTAHVRRLLRAADLPISAFVEGRALEMLCYLSLQALPRHSRLYANMHLNGGWHDGVEMQYVHFACVQHAPHLLSSVEAVTSCSPSSSSAAAPSRRLGPMALTRARNRGRDQTGGTRQPVRAATWLPAGEEKWV